MNIIVIKITQKKVIKIKNLMAFTSGDVVWEILLPSLVSILLLLLI